MAKNIIVFSDGTGQEGGEGPDTNIYKLFKMLENRTERQVAFYDRGLGTGWRKITGNIGGMGISDNILECYHFIFENYQAGDKLFLFGFSRGATTVRSLSSFIHLFGILPKSRPELIKRAWKIYKIRETAEQKQQRASQFAEKRHHTMWAKIDCLAVWDTVAALGIPIRPISLIMDRLPFFHHRFHNLFLSESVKCAYHAVAIDDERKTFHPVLWETATEEARDRIEKKSQKIKQMWFCGMHTDVGGGYAEDGLSDIPLVWMIQQAVQNHGLLIYPRHKIALKPDANALMHDSRGKFWTRFYRRRERTWKPGQHGQLYLHRSVLERKYRNQEGRKEPESFYRLTELSLAGLKNGHLPVETIIKLRPLLNVKYVEKKAFLADIEDALGEDAAVNYFEQILDHARTSYDAWVFDMNYAVEAVYRLSAGSLAQLRKAKVPKKLLDKLAPLQDQAFNGKAEFLEQIRKVTEAEAADADERAEHYRALIFEHAEALFDPWLWGDNYYACPTGEWDQQQWEAGLQASYQRQGGGY